MVTATFDEPNPVSPAGLVLILGLAAMVGLHEVSDTWLSVPTDNGAKVASLVAGMLAGADSIDDMSLLRHGGMKRLFTRCYAPSTLGSFTCGHICQLDAIASRYLANLNHQTPILVAAEWLGGDPARGGDHRPSRRQRRSAEAGASGLGVLRPRRSR